VVLRGLRLFHAVLSLAQPLLKRIAIMKVLIAEDSDSVRFALRFAVESLGHEVVGLVCNGRQALEQYPAKRPDIVVMDVQMPDLDGLTCTSLLAKQDPPGRVLIVTGTRYDEQDARLAGAKGYLAKPFALEDLSRLLQIAATA
jgi:two-component system response regulator AlgR